MTTIPNQLRDPTFRFVKIRPGEKGAFERGWTEDANYGFEPIEEWVKAGGNYGVVAGSKNLILIESDCVGVAAAIRSGLPRTFEVQSGSKKAGGFHFYFFCPDLMENIVFKGQADGNDSGRIQVVNKYLVAPGSVHPSGNIYEVFNDAPIVEVKADAIKTACAEFWPEVRAEKKPAACVDSGAKVPLEKIIDLSKLNRVGAEYVGAHPTHGSTTGHNFAVNLETNKWYCFRHSVGGGWPSLLAVVNGLMLCEEVAV